VRKVPGTSKAHAAASTSGRPTSQRARA
jgi:hypothetical protein